MYEVIALFKPEMTVQLKDVVVIAEQVAAKGDARVAKNENSVIIEDGEAQLILEFSDAPHVIEEANEIAELFDVPCQGCKSRVEMSGYDPDMVLINDYTMLIERLAKNENVILFDPVEGALLET